MGGGLMTEQQARSERNDPTRAIGWVCFFAFASCVPIANWLVENVGLRCVPNGPCLIPVAPGFDAPSGVLMIGLALVLRDVVHRSLGVQWSLGAIALGGLLSLLTANPALVVASTIAFILSELFDFAVFVPLLKRGFMIAVVISSTVGAIVDGAVFLLIAFGDLAFLPGQTIGKGLMIIATIPLIKIMRTANS